jgi:uncharacterized membrane protein YfcA
MSDLELIIIAVVGILSGFVNIMAGGGSMISVPTMIFFGLPGPVANGSLRIAIIAESIAALIEFFRKGIHRIGLSLSLTLFTIPGAIIGAHYASQIRAEDFNKILAGVMLLVLLMMVFDRSSNTTAPDSSVSISKSKLVLGHALMILVGFWGGFIQIGVGFLMIPILSRVLGLDLITTNMHKTFIVLLYTVAALIVFSQNQQLDWRAGTALAVGSVIGAILATKVQLKFGTGAIKVILYATLIVFIIKLFFF